MVDDFAGQGFEFIVLVAAGLVTVLSQNSELGLKIDDLFHKNIAGIV
jgi:hypothetical protein